MARSTMREVSIRESSHGRASGPGPGRTRSARTGGRPGRPALAALALGLTATVAGMATVFPGATRDDGPAGDTPRYMVPMRPAPGGTAPAAAVSPVAAAPASDRTAWRTDYARALALAAEQGRPVLLRFTAEWCAPCRVMDRSVFPDREVRAALAERAIPVKLDIDDERNAELAWRYGVRGVPTLLLVDADGKVLDRAGFLSAEALVRFLRRS